MLISEKNEAYPIVTQLEKNSGRKIAREVVKCAKKANFPRISKMALEL